MKGAAKMAMETLRLFDDEDGHFFSFDLLSQLAHTSPSFQLWAEAALPSGDFERLAKAALRLGLIDSLAEAITFFDNICSGIIEVPLALCDLQGKKDAHRRSRRAVRELFNLNESDPSGTDSHRIYGITSHSAARLFASGEILKPTVSNSLSLFDLDDASYPNSSALSLNIEAILQSKRSLNSYLRDIYDLWLHMCNVPKKADILSLLPDTRQLLSPFLIFYINQIRNGHYSWFELETLRIWAAWLLRASRDEPWFLFSEIPALDKSWNLPGGRIDAIRVVSINGKKINKKQAETIRAMHKYRFASVGWIVAALIAEFGRNIELELIDWKFAVGDSTKGNREIKLEEVFDRPFPYHRHQMERYLTSVVIDTILVSNRIDGVNTNLNALTGEGCKYLFEAYNFFTRGTIAYFFPNYPEPLNHTISMSSREQRDHFVETVMAIPAAQRNAIVRDGYNRITALLTNRANAGKKNFNSPSTLNIFDTE